MFIGIDIGTSSVKVVLLDREQRVRVSASAPLTVQQPHPLWREQNPNDWWQACESALDGVLRNAEIHGIDREQIEAVGLSGQMHGAVLLNSNDQVLRPAILWNDGRSHLECEELEQLVPESRKITGNQMMPGFTAPKLLWVAKHEPQLFVKIAKVLLPKDYIRFCLTGEYASDMSDASGMLWLDMARRDWNDELLSATGLSRKHMPRLYEGPEITGKLSPKVANQFGLKQIPVMAGAGDNAAGAIGMGIAQPGQAMLSLGTSGVFFAATDGFLANPAQSVHSFCHALPNTWHLMSVMLSAASCLEHTQQLAGYADVSKLLEAAEVSKFSQSTPYYLPYLNGERTPHNKPGAKAVFFGIDSGTVSADIANATLEGVGQGLLDGIEAVEKTGIQANEIVLVGGGSRSNYWAQMLADIFNRPLVRREGGELGPALGAARLAQLGIDGGSVDDSFLTPTSLGEFLPNPAAHEYFSHRRVKFHQLYEQLAPLYSTV